MFVDKREGGGGSDYVVPHSHGFFTTYSGVSLFLRQTNFITTSAHFSLGCDDPFILLLLSHVSSILNMYLHGA